MGALPVAAVVPVSDLDRTRAFFDEMLGLSGERAPGGYRLNAGENTRIFLLDGTDYAGQAEWPLASFETEDLAAAIAELGARGLRFEIMGEGDPYETDKQGIADLGDVLIAWFRDPDGQVFAIFQSK